MMDKQQGGQGPAPLGHVEPHAALLVIPPERQKLYKVMSAENLVRSVVGRYLHFNRVDSYADFPGADPDDGRQLAQDESGNASARFQNATRYTAADYYNESRARTYACCFSLEDSDYIWENYASSSERGKVCVVFDFGRLRSRINHTLQSGGAALSYKGNRCRQIFSVNYGLVKYIDRHEHQANTTRLPNPIVYTYLKDKQFAEEQELRVSLSAIGIGQFALRDGSTLQFPNSLSLTFDFHAAIVEGAIVKVLCAPDTDRDFLNSELNGFHIALSDG